MLYEILAELFLFYSNFPIGDGLRADKLFQLYSDLAFPEQRPLPAFEPHRLRHFDLTQRDGKAPLVGPGYSTPAPFLRSLILDNQASYGVSWTRVPTECRLLEFPLLFMFRAF